MDEQIGLKDDADVVAAWKSGLALGRRVGFSPYKQACLSSAVLELSRNVVESGGGVCVMTDASDARTRRAAISLRGAGGELAERAKQRLNADMAIGPALPAVKLRQIVETCDVEPGADGATITITIHEPRLAARVARPLAMVGGRRA